MVARLRSTHSGLLKFALNVAHRLETCWAQALRLWLESVSPARAKRTIFVLAIFVFIECPFNLTDTT